ncbi:MAG: ribonuclease domain-containing protein [Sulfuritalea sp.]|nr:ribonuclease domain-containing protein [Sulfuritalea sp.]
MRRLLCALIGATLFGTALARDNSIGAVPAAALPEQARTTLKLIDSGGPFPYRRDGIVFQNRERRLPKQAKGYYREYTVQTPGSADRGARRIVTGDRPPAVFYYTADHYQSFRRIQR